MTQIFLDFSTDLGPATQKCNGFSCTSISATEPPDELLKPLKPSMIQGYGNWVKIERFPSIFSPGTYERLPDELEMTIQIRVFSTFGYHHLENIEQDPYPGDGGDWTRWERFLGEFVD